MNCSMFSDWMGDGMRGNQLSSRVYHVASRDLTLALQVGKLLDSGTNLLFVTTSVTRFSSSLLPLGSSEHCNSFGTWKSSVMGSCLF